jgi:sugar phosphate isomerase/epimerase
MKTRREFLIQSSLTAAGIITSPIWLQGAPAIIKNYNKSDSSNNGVQIGCITYSFRAMPDQSAEATLHYVKECGLSAIELMGDPAENFAGIPSSPIDRMRMFQLGGKARRGEELTADEQKELNELRTQSEAFQKEVASWRATADMKKFEQFRKMYNEAGVKIYAFKPSAFGQNNSDAEIAYGMNAAKALGATHVTLEHPSDDAHTLKLGKMGEKYGMAVGYHGHEQETFDFWDKALEQSPKNGLNLDAGHYIAAGHSDLLPLITKHNKRILSMHIKDRTSPDNGKGNVMWGTGDTPITEMLQLMKAKKYQFPATIEMEYQVPSDSNAVKEVQKCVEYCRKALS